MEGVDAVGELAHVDFAIPNVAAESLGRALPEVPVEPVAAGACGLGTQPKAQQQAEDC